MSATLNKKFLLLAVIGGLFIAFYYVAQAAPNASVVLKKDASTGLFLLTIRDSEGIKDFSLKAPNKLPYGAGLAGCVKSFENNNVLFADPDDFTPALFAEITDCKGNITQLELLPPSDGVSRGKITNAAPPPAPVSEAPSVESEAAPSDVAPTPIKTKIEEASTLPSTITYPVKELGNCQNETECKLYCDDAGHIKECLDFAKKFNLISSAEVAKAEKFLAIGKGPGGCDSQKSCESYCSDVSRIDECLSFAEENGFMEGSELEEAKKISVYIKSGGGLPGGCKDRNACEVYCSSGDNIDECLAFAEKAGFMPPEELAEAKKFVQFMKSGETPGGCRSKDQCKNYCDNEANLEECIDFAAKAGFIPPEELEIVRKTGGKGPGGCRGKEQCEAYCEANQEECFNWAQANGVMREEDLKRMQEGMGRFKAELANMPPEMIDCLKTAVGEEALNKITSGEPVFDRNLGEKMQSCANQFEEQIKEQFQGQGFGPPGAEGGGGLPEGFSGPGGCSSSEECFEFCRQNPKECSSFGPPGGGGPGGGGFPGGPGGCQSQEECQVYCQEHPEECGSQGVPAGEHEGEFPEGFQPPEGFMPPEGFQPPEGMQEQFQGEFRKQFEGGVPPEGFQQPPEGFQIPQGFTPPPGFEGGVSPEGLQQQFQQQYQQQYQQQFETQQQEMQQQFQMPPAEFQQPAPPPVESAPPPSGPTSKLNTGYILGAVIAPFLQLLGF